MISAKYLQDLRDAGEEQCGTCLAYASLVVDGASALACIHCGAVGTVKDGKPVTITWGPATAGWPS